MPFDDLCSIDDIKGIFYDFPASLTPLANELISNFTQTIYQDAHITTTPVPDGTLLTEQKIFNMKLACSFKVLAYMESMGLVETSSDNIVRMMDGDFMVMYQKDARAGLGDMPGTYRGLYGYYFRKLLPLPPKGSKHNWRRLGSCGYRGRY